MRTEKQIIHLLEISWNFLQSDSGNKRPHGPSKTLFLLFTRYKTAQRTLLSMHAYKDSFEAIKCIGILYLVSDSSNPLTFSSRMYVGGLFILKREISCTLKENTSNVEQKNYIIHYTLIRRLKKFYLQICYINYFRTSHKNIQKTRIFENIEELLFGLNCYHCEK